MLIDRKGEKMEFEQAIPQTVIAFDSKEAKRLFFQMLDEAIDDMEQGRVLSEEEFWRDFYEKDKKRCAVNQRISGRVFYD